MIVVGEINIAYSIGIMKHVCDKFRWHISGQFFISTHSIAWIVALHFCLKKSSLSFPFSILIFFYDIISCIILQFFKHLFKFIIILKKKERKKKSNNQLNSFRPTMVAGRDGDDCPFHCTKKYKIMHNPSFICPTFLLWTVTIPFISNHFQQILMLQF